jgi:hypothetical protein
MTSDPQPQRTPSTIGRVEIRAAHALVCGANADLAAFD